MDSNPDRRRVRVVVIDDQEIVRRTISKLLGRAFDDVEVVAVGDPSAALGLRATEPDLMIINGAMPGVDGPTVIARVRAFEAATGRPRLPMLIESGSPDYLDAGVRAGADAALQMPPASGELVSTTRDLLASRGRRPTD